MDPRTGRSLSPCHILILAVALAGAALALQARQGINLGDEGFLWYGVQRTAAGEIPLRDFQSYDPGRYYCSAAATFLFGDGLVALRFSETLFQALGLWVGLLAASRIARNWAQLAAIGVMLTIWMFPSHKLFDHALLLGGIWIAVRMIEEPSPGRIFAAGFFAGLCVFFGRNHALYSFLAQGALLSLIYFKLRPTSALKTFAMWSAGITIGLLPTIAMFACAPGFSAAYAESVRAILHHGTNLPLPFPWPWHVSSEARMARLFLAIFLIVLPIGYLTTIVLSLFNREEIIKTHALFFACAFLGLFYFHHAFSRADLSHLAQSIHPFALGLLAIPHNRARYRHHLLLGAGLLTLVGLLLIAPRTPIYQRWNSRSPWLPFDVESKVFVPADTQKWLDCLREFATKNIPPNESVLIAPFAPGLYPILERRAPLWDLAFYFPATLQRQSEMIRALKMKNVRWAIVSDIPLDKREDLRLSVTHKLLWQYLTQNFETVEKTCLPKTIKIVRRKDPSTSY